jgi:hypothetical protein
MPGSKVGDAHPLSPFGKGDDVLVSFHSPMLGADGSDRPFTFSHGWPVAISYAIPEDISAFFLLGWYDHITPVAWPYHELPGRRSARRDVSLRQRSIV